MNQVLSMLLTEGAAATGQQPGLEWMIIYVVVIGAILYFMMIRPQKKQQKKMEELQASLEPGDSVLTTSGFYGVVLDVNDDVVIVEFGNNKNCRIPMKKEAIHEVEKANPQTEE